MVENIIWSDENEKKIIDKAKRIKDLGFSGEAQVEIYMMKDFPGIGGVIGIEQSIAVALRTERNKTPGLGHDRFLIHSIMKKLDDFFFRTGKYEHAHVTRPLGSVDNAYIYEWVYGGEGFAWEIQGGKDKDYRTIPVRLEEWDKCAVLFSEAGIDMHRDITDVDDGRISKNIIHQLYFGIDFSDSEPSLNQNWKRIDFGSASLPIKYDELMKYLHDNEDKLRKVLDTENKRFDLMKIACQYLADKDSLSQRDLGSLVELVHNYRCSTLRHLNLRGFGPEGIDHIKI